MKARKMTLELMLSTHDKKCLSCVRSENCELQKLCRDYGVEDVDAFEGENPQSPLDETTLHMVRDNNKCILCRRCVAACEDQFVGVIGPNGRGFDTHIGCAFEKDLGDVACVSCGQCIVNCPTGALREKDQIDEVVAAIADPKKHVVVQTAPSVRAALGEEFGMPIGTNVEGKMVAALRRLGFDKVFDTDFGADMTIMEEAHEFIDRVQNGGVLPLITSCSPGWIKFCEFYYPELLPNLSSCKSRSRCRALSSRPGTPRPTTSIRRISCPSALCPAPRRNSRSAVTMKTRPAFPMWTWCSPSVSWPG